MRFNGRISDVLATRRYESGKEFGSQTLKRYTTGFTITISPQKALHHQSPDLSDERMAN